jgi:hypothetical protein
MQRKCILNKSLTYFIVTANTKIWNLFGKLMIEFNIYVLRELLVKLLLAVSSKRTLLTLLQIRSVRTKNVTETVSNREILRSHAYCRLPTYNYTPNGINIFSLVSLKQETNCQLPTHPSS